MNDNDLIHEERQEETFLRRGKTGIANEEGEGRE